MKKEYKRIENGVDFYIENGSIKSIDIQPVGEHPLIELDFNSLIELAIELAPDQMKEFLSNAK